MRVEVEAVEAAGETVTFRWRQSEPNRFQRVNEFFIRYQDVDLARFSVELFYEIFLGLQLKVFAAYPGRVELVFPSPVPKSTADYWTAFRGAKRVSISPVDDRAAFSPWAGEAAPSRNRRAALFFGGGKDSLLGACLLRELFGPDEVALIQFIGPLRIDDAHAKRIETRQEALMLEPARANLGVATQKVWTNFQAIFRPEGYRARPNLELYSVASLPALLDWNVTVCSFSMSWHVFTISKTTAGQDVLRHERVRPEALATHARHYQRAFGANFDIVNITLPFAQQLTIKLLAERYPDAAADVVMCTQAGVGERWCGECKKCGEYALYTLLAGHADPRFDYSRFFCESKYMRTVTAFAESGVELTAHGNLPWFDGFSTPANFFNVCDTLAGIDLGAARAVMTAEALGNLTFLTALYGNRRFPAFGLVWADALNQIGGGLGPRVGAIAAEHLEIAEALPGPFAVGNDPAVYRFDGVPPARTAHLAHLREV